MRSLFSTLVVWGLLVAGSSAVFSAEEGLFSRVSVTSVFTQSGNAAVVPSPEDSLASVREKVTNAGQLGRMLRDAGLESKGVGERVVTTKMQLDTWSFPVLVTISEDEARLGIVLLLSTIKDGRVPASKLLGLLELNRKHASSNFAYSSKRKRVELYTSIKNQGISGQQLRDKIEGLAALAKKTESSWQIKSATASASLDATTTEPALSQASLVGRWSASRSKTEAFAAQFAADGTFTLVYVNQGKKTQSTGKFTLEGQSLVLAGAKGLRLTGKITLKSGKEFQFLPENAASTAVLTFKKAT